MQTSTTCKKYAFVYAAGDERHVGEIKIGMTTNISFEAALAAVTSRYKIVYGRALRVYQVVPVGLPAREAEDLLKFALRDYHDVGELYTLQASTSDEVARQLELVFGEFEVDITAAHFIVEDATPRQQRRAYRDEQSAITARTAARVARKRMREVERAEVDYEQEVDAADQDEMRHALAMWGPSLKLIQHTLDLQRAHHEAKLQPESIDTWALQAIVTVADGTFRLEHAFQAFHEAGVSGVTYRQFSSRLKELYPGSFHAQWRVAGVNTSGVFTGLQML
ncbi:MAG: hypothetical protein MMC23_010190 [Stictis urceolatum]|nr:hypothetical protein [Stictis urceolata]